MYYDAAGDRAQIFAFNYTTATPRHLILQDLPGANVGIGTSSPLAKLDVRGDIRMGSSGQLRATAGEENLRLLRGNVDGNGTILNGTGFTVVRFAEGIYDITFVPSFAGVPTVTANAHRPAGNLRWPTQFDLTSSGVRIYTEFSAGDRTDSDFSFCVIGPR